MADRYLPRPLPNEHLLSTLARWFDLSGRNDFLTTARALSTNLVNITPAAVWRPIYWDLANHYVATIEWETLLREHTLVPYYLPFLEDSLKAVLVEGGQALAHTKIQSTQQNRVRHAHHWRWCLECAEYDFETFGTTYWHVYHQIPSMLVCYQHKTTLVSECQRCGFAYQHFSRHWLPPMDGSCRECQYPITSPEGHFLPINHRLDAISIGLQTHGVEITQSSIIRAMRQKIGFDSLPSNLTVSMREHVSTLQQQFQAWIPDSILATYFSVNREQAFKQSNQILKLVSVAYRERNAPPLCVLLMLMFLELDDDLLGNIACQSVSSEEP